MNKTKAIGTSIAHINGKDSLFTLHPSLTHLIFHQRWIYKYISYSIWQYRI